MSLEHRAVAPLRVFLVLLFALLVMLQTFSLPGQFAHMAEESPQLAHLQWPLTAVSAWLVLLGVSLYVGSQADDPGLPILLLLVSIGVTVLGLLMVVLRALLRQATALRTDLEAVI